MKSSQGTDEARTGPGRRDGVIPAPRERETRSEARRRGSRYTRSRRSRYARRRGFAIVTAVAGFLLVGFLLADLLGGEGGIQRGVSIGDVDVGGMSREEARAAVERNATETFRNVSFGRGHEAVSVSAEDLGVRVNADAAVDEAYAVGRGGIFDKIGSYFGGTQIGLEAGYDEPL